MTRHWNSPVWGGRGGDRPQWIAALLVAVGVLAGGLAVAPTPAAAGDLVLVCPANDKDPFFRDEATGKRVKITDAQHLALAKHSCAGELAATPNSAVSLVNKRNTTIYVGFTGANQQPATIEWGAGCTKSGTGASIAAGKTCAATVPAASGSTRFCASTTSVPTNCWDAQTNHQTIVETTFEDATNPGCFNKGNCVWFDISVIPSSCTDALWDENMCSSTGGAAYNLPVSLGCGSQTVYSCAGPPVSTWGNSRYPGHCGNPASTSQGGANGQNAYFYPMFDPPESAYQPNTVCLGGQTLVVTYLAGQ